MVRMGSPMVGLPRLAPRVAAGLGVVGQFPQVRGGDENHGPSNRVLAGGPDPRSPRAARRHTQGRLGAKWGKRLAPEWEEPRRTSLTDPVAALAWERRESRGCTPAESIRLIVAAVG